jgi:hypothetical protein
MWDDDDDLEVLTLDAAQVQDPPRLSAESTAKPGRAPENRRFSK